MHPSPEEWEFPCSSKVTTGVFSISYSLDSIHRSPQLWKVFSVHTRSTTNASDYGMIKL